MQVDGALVEGAVEDPDGTVRLDNGCACCEGSDNLFGALEKLTKSAAKRAQRWDYLVVELSGIAEAPCPCRYDSPPECGVRHMALLSAF